MTMTNHQKPMSKSRAQLLFDNFATFSKLVLYIPLAWLTITTFESGQLLACGASLLAFACLFLAHVTHANPKNARSVRELVLFTHQFFVSNLAYVFFFFFLMCITAAAGGTWVVVFNLVLFGFQVAFTKKTYNEYVSLKNESTVRLEQLLDKQSPPRYDNLSAEATKFGIPPATMVMPSTPLPEPPPYIPSPQRMSSTPAEALKTLSERIESGDDEPGVYDVVIPPSAPLPRITVPDVSVAKARRNNNRPVANKSLPRKKTAKLSNMTASKRKNKTV